MDDPLAADREEIRQAHVFASGLLWLAGDARLQRIVDTAAEAFEMPMAAISIIDRDRQFFPVSVGLDVTETDRALAFCAHAIETCGAVMCVPDARLDERFATNALVTGPPDIRFYAGYPLEDPPGTALGTLCIIGREPRAPLTSQEQERFVRLAELCQAEIARARSVFSSNIAAADLIAGQIQRAVDTGNETLVTELDRILQETEEKVRRGRAARRDFPPRI